MHARLARSVSEGLLGSLSDDEQRDLLERGRQRRYRRGEVLYHEGDESDWVVVLRDGRVKVSSFSSDGREAVLAVLGPGELMGELSAFDGQARSASITALEDVTATVIPAGAFRAFLESCPRVAVLLLETLSHRLRDADRKRVEFGAFDTQARVARRLVELADRFGESSHGSVRITLALTQEELAAWVGASREGVSKALGTLRTRGWIETQRRGITVVDLDALRRLAR